MLSSTRHSAGQAVLGLSRPSWSLALHAESSRQGALRYQTHQHLVPISPVSVIRKRSIHSKALFSAAATAVVTETGTNQSYPPEYYSSQSQWTGHSRHSRTVVLEEEEEEPPDREPHEEAPVRRSPRNLSLSPPSTKQPLETPLDRFRSQLSSEPVKSLLSLPSLSPDQLETIPIEDFDELLSSLRMHLQRNLLPPSIDSNDILAALVQLRTGLYDRQTKNMDYLPNHGERLQRKRFYKFVRICLLLGQKDFVKKLWKQAVSIQTEGKVKPINEKKICQILREELRDWKMILWLFHPSNYPVKLYNGEILESVIQANLATNQPNLVPHLFDKHKELDIQPTKASRCHLIQALLAIGDVEEGKKATVKAVESGMEVEELQLAILRGHRVLGGNTRLEEKVSGDLDKLEIKQDSRLLNTLIKLRLDARDIEAAKNLMKRFDLEGGEVKAGKETYSLALQIASREEDLNKMKVIWDILCQNPAQVLDIHLSIVINALCDSNQLQQAKNIILAPQLPGSFALPIGFKPGVQSLNALLQQMAKSQSHISDFSRIIKRFPRLHLTPNDYTMQVLVKYLNSAHVSPTDLATFVQQFSKEFPDLKGNIATLDVIMSSAIRESMKSKPNQTSFISASADSSTPTAGLNSVNPFKRAMSSILQSANSSKQKSTSTGISNRLEFDAFYQAKSGIVPSANTVWDSLLSRGFKPDPRHITSLMKGYMEASAMNEACEILELARDYNIEWDNSMWLILLIGWGRVGDLMRCKDAYGRIKFSKEGLNVVVVTAMIKALYQNRIFDEASEMTKNVLIKKFYDQLDTKAVYMAFNALRSNNEELTALELIKILQLEKEFKLDMSLKSGVRSVRNWLGKFDGPLSYKEGGLRLCGEILETEKERGGGERKLGSKTIRKKLLDGFKPKERRGRLGQNKPVSSGTRLHSSA